MFMNTIAVPFFGPVLWVTGATDALPLLHCALYAERAGVAVAVAVAGVTRLAARVKGVRRAIEKCVREKKRTSVSECYKDCSRGQTTDLNNVAR
jgi:hypothetical protein